MKNSIAHYIVCMFILTGLSACAQPLKSINIDKVVIDETDPYYGYYLTVQPNSDKIEGIMVLFPGFGQKAEDIFLDTKLHKVATQHNLLTIGFAGRNRLTADSVVRVKITAVLKHVLQHSNIDPSHFVLGGFSAGGNIALRYAELCKQFPDRYPIDPKGVFMADAPVDLYHSWSLQQENVKNNFSEISVAEANWVRKFYLEHYGATPSNNPKLFMDLSPFSIDKAYGNNERFLQDVAVRSYHDVDISWRLLNRNQTARFDNYIATSELINRLLLMGNDKAEFIQTFKTGYRRNGDRHPHSWSIIEPYECIEWIQSILKQ